MKKIFITILLLFSSVIPYYVLAKGNYMTQNGVLMDASNYEKLCEIYSKGYVETLTIDEYKNLINDNFKNVKKVTYDFGNVKDPLRSQYYNGHDKTISIVKNGSYITLLAKWKSIPSVFSYDVIAVRLSGVTLNGSFTFKQVYKSGGTYYTIYNGNNQTFSNGFGSSALLHSGTDQQYSLTFKVTGTGTVYGSYQHATSTVTLNQSKNYTISSSGLGGVINFASSVIGYYDGTPGVDLSV